MHFFTDYIQPLTFWIYEHPHLALVITFLISLAESLAIIGSVVPGSVTMTAIGILAGSGVMRIDLTFIAATLGAVAGDGLSYLLGYHYSDRLGNIWPFSRYPSWLKYGKDFFTRHGGKSVLIGRFVGPLRSIIPVIAGMMHMRHWHFLLANIASAIGWSILYVMPGVLIGAASNDLSADDATHLFVVILIVLAAIWMLSQALHWLYQNAGHLFRANLLRLWTWARHYKTIAVFFKRLSPRHEKNHYPTMALTVSIVVCSLVSLLLTIVALKHQWLSALNTSIHLFFQSLRTTSFDVFFILISLFTHPLSLTIFALSILGYGLYYRDWRLLRFWVSLCLSNAVVICLLRWAVNHAVSFPEVNLTFATSLFIFWICYTATHYSPLIARTQRIVLLTLLFFAGISILYLSDNTLCGILAAYFIGLTIALIHWILYRRVIKRQFRPLLTQALIGLVFLTAASLSYVFYFQALIRAHVSNPHRYVLTYQAWWGQQQPLLPLYTTNRFGQRIGLYNIQYAGSLNQIQTTLENHGWNTQPDLFFYSLMMRAGGKNSIKELPILAQLYLNKKPALIMTFDPGKGEDLFILRLWRSNYYLNGSDVPLWLGSMIYPRPKIKGQKMPVLSTTTLFAPLLTALKDFTVSQVSLPLKHMRALPQQLPPTLLIIQEPQDHL